MTVLFCSAFQFFHSYGKAFETQPLAPYLLLEATLGVLIVLAGTTVLFRLATGRVRALDLFFLGVPLCWLLVSALSAWVVWGQPPILGVGEDRRALTFLYWFAFDPVRRRYGLTFRDILIALFACACVYLAVALGVQTWLPKQLEARDIPALDARRLRMSAAGDCFAVCLLIGVTLWLQRGASWFNAAAALVGAIGLIEVAETRQFTLAAALSVLIMIWRLRPAQALAVTAVIVAAVLALVVTSDLAPLAELTGHVLPNMQEFTGRHLFENARWHTATTTFDLLAGNHFLPLGAVSLLYDGGLQRLYGRDFFVNDVGLLGEAFKVGAFLLLFIVAYGLLAWRLILRMPAADRPVVLAILLFYIILAPTDGFFYRIGFVHAFLFLLMSSPAALVRTKVVLRRPMARLSGVAIKVSPASG